LIENAERFARIDLGQSRFEKERNHCKTCGNARKSKIKPEVHGSLHVVSGMARQSSEF